MPASLPPLDVLAAELGFPPDACLPYGRDVLKILPTALPSPARSAGRLILVSAITPTAAGEGKTTVAIGLAQGLQRLGHRAVLALRQPSMGPVFGRKGGATGAGLSSLVPAERINLHFTGDFHAITTAHNLLAATLDNRLHFRTTRIDPQQVLWRRVLDLNDRALRRIVVGCGDPAVEHAGGFDITASSEIMAVLCLADSMQDLRARLDRIVVGRSAEGDPVRAAELGVTGALLALLREAMLPNLVRSTEGTPALVHGGPFGNIAHGCSSLVATRLGLASSDFLVTEAGFGFDLGGFKFIDIKCRQAGLAPDAIVLVASLRALKRHGGRAEDDLQAADAGAVARGLANLEAHLEAAGRFGRPLVVALNRFATDLPAELDQVRAWCRERGLPCEVTDGVARGGEGAEALAGAVADAAARPSPPLEPLYPLEATVEDKLRAIATHICGAAGVQLSPAAHEKLEWIRQHGLDQLPVCLSKTQASLSDDPRLPGRPRDFELHVRDFEVAAGAGYLVALTGSLVRMPALPEHPAAERIDVAADGTIVGLA